MNRSECWFDSLPFMQRFTRGFISILIDPDDRLPFCDGKDGNQHGASPS